MGDAVEVVSMIHLKGPEGPIELNPVDGPMGWEWNGVSARPVSEDVIEVSWGGRTLRAHVAVEGDRAWVNLDGHVLVFDALLGPTNASMEGGLTAPMPGVVLDVHVAEGDQVEQGQPLMVLEAMKMEHRILAPSDSIVGNVPWSIGDRVDQDVILIELHPIDTEGT